MREEQKQRLLDSSEKFERSNNKLAASYSVLLETEEMGHSVLRDLHSQRETIQKSRSRVCFLFDKNNLGYTNISTIWKWWCCVEHFISENFEISQRRTRITDHSSLHATRPEMSFLFFIFGFYSFSWERLTQIWAEAPEFYRPWSVERGSTNSSWAQQSAFWALLFYLVCT